MTEYDDIIRKLKAEKATADMDAVLNLRYYEANHVPTHIGMAIPAPLRRLYSSAGYPRIYVDAIADRIDMEGFEVPKDDGGLAETEDGLDDLLWKWWKANELETESPLGHTEAMIQGRSYITISTPIEGEDDDWDPEIPIIKVESSNNLYAKVSRRTNRVESAIRIVTEDLDLATEYVTLYLPGKTVQLVISGGNITLDGPPIEHDLGIVPVVPITNRSRTSDVVGQTQINRELRGLTDAAGRVLLNLQGASELLAFPFRVVAGATQEDLGVGPDGKSEIEAYLSHFLALEDPEARVSQLSAADLRNYTETLDSIGKQAASVTGLPPQYLSVQSDNPASAEAIRAAESRLVKTAERKIKLFGSSWERALRIALRVMDKSSEAERARHLRILWRDPSTPTYAAKADGAVK